MNEVVVTGVGLVSSLGEGLEAHLAALRGDVPPNVDAARFAPYPVHPLAPVEWDRQIPKKADQRQMETWQRLGCYAAGLALDAAGLTGDPALKAATHLVVACGGGERDYAADSAILTGLRTAADPGVFLNERLMGDLRPTLFLAQLSNLLAGNIAIVHGVTGASRTFMGEESAGVDALRIAQARVAAGQADLILVGGSYNAERPDSLLVFELGGFLWKHPFVPVRERAEAGGGFILGSAGAFLVLESARHATRRGARALARLPAIGSARSRRAPGDVANSLARLWNASGLPADAPVLSAATGASGPAGEEFEALSRLAPGASVHATGDLVGHVLEVAAPLAAALAVGLVADGAREVAAPVVGHRRGEGLVRVAALS